MFKKTKLSYYKLGAAMTTGMLMGSASSAHAANNFGSIANNMTLSTSQLPALLTALAYLFGILLGALGIMKIKDHVENPTQTPLKDGAIRLAAGGALFALPIVLEAMSETIDQGGNSGSATGATLYSVSFSAS